MVPKVFLGTSPFIGAGQFGEKSVEYYRKFYLHPENITRIIVKSWDLGVKGIQLLPLPPLVEAVRKAIEKGSCPPFILGSVGIDNLRSEVKALEGLGAAGALLHARIADTLSVSIIESALRFLEERFKFTGFVTHFPRRTLSWFSTSGLKARIALVPFNRMGYMFDDDLDSIVRAIRSFNGIVLAKKVLAAGRLKPREALEFVSSEKSIYGVVLGVASEEEAEETLGAALKIYREKDQLK